MHDLYLANQIIKLILSYAEKNKFKKVTSAVIGLGKIVEHGTEITPENLKFNLKMLAKNTVADGLDIQINKIKSNSWILKEIEGR